MILRPHNRYYFISHFTDRNKSLLAIVPTTVTFLDMRTGEHFGGNLEGDTADLSRPFAFFVVPLKTVKLNARFHARILRFRRIVNCP